MLHNNKSTGKEPCESQCASYTHDPVVEDATGLLVGHVGVVDVTHDAPGCSLEGAACTGQPVGTHILQLARLKGQNVE